jgi:hypothetical protein
MKKKEIKENIKKHVSKEIEMKNMKVFKYYIAELLKQKKNHRYKCLNLKIIQKGNDKAINKFRMNNLFHKREKVISFIKEEKRDSIY